MKRRFVSFDVFDTCLIRRCGSPEKIWDLMADKLFDGDDIRGRLSFTGNRSMAEKSASQKKTYPTMEDIYSELNVSQWGFPTEAIMNLEMEVETQELYANPSLLDTVNKYRDNGFEIAFISDMYLPTSFIKKILVKYGFCKEKEFVFVSAECKAGKFDGKLFDYAFKTTNTKAKQWIHYGDNERSDFRIPKLKGVKAILVNDTKFTDEEKRWQEDAKFYPCKHEIELWTGLCRLTRLQNNRSFAADMAIDFIASVYVPYVVYVLRKAKDIGIKTLYFLARDGHIFYEIAKSLKIENGDVECRYLKISRRALHKCVFYKVDDFELSMVVGNALNQTVENVLKFIGIEYSDLKEETRKEFGKNYALNNKKRVKNFSESLKANAEIIKEASKRNRKLLLAYLRQEKFFDTKAAAVDLGWVGSCRCILNYILQNEGHDRIPTFYWGYNKSLIYGDKNDELFVFNKQYDSVEKCSCSNLFFEEYASLVPSGTTIGYKSDGDIVVPIEGPNNTDAEIMSALNEKMVVDFSKRITADFKINNQAYNEIFLCCGLRQMENILNRPNRKHIELFKSIEFENYSLKFKMVRRLPVKDILALLVWGIPASSIWAEMAIVETFGPFSDLFTKLYKFTSKTIFASKLRSWWDNR